MPAFSLRFFDHSIIVASFCLHFTSSTYILLNLWSLLRWLERVLVFFDALYLGVKIFRLELANHDQILPQNNDNIKVSIFCRFLKKFVAMATQLGFEV